MRYLNFSMPLQAALILVLPLAHADQVRIAGDQNVDFAKDTNGLDSYVANGTMCVVHKPGCSSNALKAIVGGGHNGKDHFFPKEKSLPAGVTLAGVQYHMYWPAGIDHTDRGGVGSKGSYGASADSHFQAKPPLYSVHWENACQASTSADWSTLPIAYQVSFILNVPAGVNVPGSVPYSPSDPIGLVCHAGDIPVAMNPLPPQPIAVYLSTKGTWFEGSFGTTTSGKLLTISNGEQFELELIADANMPGGCGKAGNKALPVGQKVDAGTFYGSKAIYPKVIGACAPYALTPGRQSVGVVVTYLP
jgi:hypothetical protein